MMKTMVVNTVELNGQTCYRLVQITDSLKYTPGELISKIDLQRLCEMNNWKITVKKEKTPQ